MKIEEMAGLKEKLQELLGQLERFCFFVRRQRFYEGNELLKDIWEKLPVIADMLSAHVQELNEGNVIFDIEGLLLSLKELQKAQLAGDYVMQADLYECQLIPVFTAIEEKLVTAMGICIDEGLLKKNAAGCAKANPQLLFSLFSEEIIAECQKEEPLSEQCMEKLVQTAEQCMAKGLFVEPTSCGMNTLAFQKGEQRYYMHSNGSVIKEALLLAEEWLKQGKENYSFYGLGFGYAYREMLLQDQNISIRVFETNRELLILAMLFAPLWQLFDSGQFMLIYDPKGYKLRKDSLETDNENGMYVFYPALRGIRQKELYESLSTYFVRESSVRSQAHKLVGNFRKNVRAVSGNIEDLSTIFQNKSVIIVAAGPSLDKNMQALKQKREGMLLVAVGTVLRKLLKENIYPDYVIMADANKSVYRQIEGLEDCNVPMLFLSTVYSRVVQNYTGRKYMLCQNGFALSEQLAAERGWQLIETGGSVVTVALDLCLRLQAAEIIFVGLDLAYTDQKDHADGTAEQAAVVHETGITVEAAQGGRIPTGKNLKLYLDWIENRIAQRTETEQRIRIIDATEGGAKKRGMEQLTLRQLWQQK